eukprot:484504-Prymnesium_polylepis.1
MGAGAGSDGSDSICAVNMTQAAERHSRGARIARALPHRVEPPTPPAAHRAATRASRRPPRCRPRLPQPTVLPLAPPATHLAPSSRPHPT